MTAGTGTVVWITGLPASGKTTLAAAVRDRLATAGRRACAVLDSDEVRDALGHESYAAADRERFYATLARLAALLSRQGLVVVVPATAPRRQHRDAARGLAPRFVEVHVRTPLEECERRDPKGLYRRARSGEAPTLPGAGAAYEAPEHPEVVADGGHDVRAVEAIVRACMGDA